MLNNPGTNDSFRVPQEPLSQDIWGFQDVAGGDLLLEPASLEGGPIPTQRQPLKSTDSTQSKPRQGHRQGADRSGIQEQDCNKLVRKARPRKPTKTDKLLGATYQTFSLDQPKPPRRRDHENNILVRNFGGQCIRCLYKHKKVC